MRQIDELKKFSESINGKIIFDYDLKKTNWFNIGGIAKGFFKPESLKEIVEFLKRFGEKEKIFILGAGSNILVNDNFFDGIVIKLGKNFSNISLLSNDTLVAGSATSDKKLAEFAAKNNIAGFEFLSCIPGTIGGGIRMNSGCFKKEFKDIVLSVQAVDKLGQVLTIPSSKIKFNYRKTNLDKSLIFLSATLKGQISENQKISNYMEDLINEKKKTQPTKIKTGGSTFKNPIDQTEEKVWQLIKKSVPLDTKFGDAEISKKHCNFFINKNNASFEDMSKLIEFVKKKVKTNTGIDLETEIEII
tara:strand:- start:336 stop:1244 length:909 start_codon:yes stop_codon:yes gene_type:complete